MPALDPIDRLDQSSAATLEASERLRQVASDLYTADVEEITAKTEVHVHMVHPEPRPPSLADGRLSDLPPIPTKGPGAGGIAVSVGGLVSAGLALAKALGWL